MRITELLFVLLFLGTLVTLLWILILTVRRHWARAKRLGLAVGIVWVVYLAIVIGTAAGEPQHILPMNQDRCFDEICFSVVDFAVVSQLGPAASPVKAAGKFYVVTVRVSSRSRGRAQSENGIRARLWNSGEYFPVSNRGEQAWEASHGMTSSLTARLNPGESVLSVQVFDVPADVPSPGLVLDHGFTPGFFVIGECPLFHKPTIVQLAS